MVVSADDHDSRQFARELFAALSARKRFPKDMMLANMLGETYLRLAVVERDAIDRELPSASGTLNTRLTIAEKELRDLEALAPLHQERLKTRKRKHEAKRSSTGVDEQVREARGRWRRSGTPRTAACRALRS